MNKIDDLLIRRRRGELSDADERRLLTAVQGSREHRLSFSVGEAFERAGAPQPGDDALVRRIVRQVDGEWSGTFPRVVPRPRFSRWVSVPLLIAGAAAASIGGYRSLDRRAESGPTERSAAAPAAAVAELKAAPLVAAPAPQPVAVGEPVPVLEPVPVPAPARTAAAPRVAVRAPAVAKVAPRAPRSKPSELPPPAAAPMRASLPPVAALEPAQGLPVEAEPSGDNGESARALFRRATRLRQTDWEAAAALFEQLTLRHAESAEAGVAEMALGKHALAEGQPQQALRWFRAYQRRPAGELAAEALWGQARALESLGDSPRARELWRQLVEQYPGSAYAAAAREQLGP